MMGDGSSLERALGKDKTKVGEGLSLYTVKRARGGGSLLKSVYLGMGRMGEIAYCRVVIQKSVPLLSLILTLVVSSLRAGPR